MIDLSNYKFEYGKAFQDSNTYFFKDGENKLVISEKIGKFTRGEKSQYLLFEYDINGFKKSEYIDRESEDFLNLKNIRPIVDRLNGIIAQCSNCGHIVLKENIRSANNDKCVYCDIYYCKKCRKAHPIIELSEERLCEKCQK